MGLTKRGQPMLPSQRYDQKVGMALLNRRRNVRLIFHLADSVDIWLVSDSGHEEFAH